MTNSTQPRVQPGVPSGGEFTAFGHSDTVPSLTAPSAQPGLAVKADMSWMNEDQAASCRASLQRLTDAGIEGTITEINTYSGDDFDYVSPEGHTFHLIIQDRNTSIWRRNEDHLDIAHRGSAMAGDYGRSTPQKIAETIAYARAQSRLTEAWLSSTTLRSTKDIQFYLPRADENPSGEYVEMMVDTEHGTFDVRAARGTGELTVAPSGTDQVLSPRMTQAFLEDLTEESGADPSEVSAAMTKTIATATGEDW